MTGEINFRDNDFTYRGRGRIYELCERVKEDVESFGYCPEEKREILQRLDNFMKKYEEAKDNYYDELIEKGHQEARKRISRLFKRSFRLN